MTRRKVYISLRKIYKAKIHFLVFVLFCVLLSSCLSNSDEPPLLENDFNFGFENTWNDNKSITPWRSSVSHNFIVDTLNKMEGANSIHILDSLSRGYEGLVYRRGIPVPAEVKDIEISCYVMKSEVGQDTFSLIGWTNDLPKGESPIIAIDSTLIVEGDKKWHRYELHLDRTKSYNSIFLAFETTGKADYWIDDFDVKFDGMSIKEFPFYSSENIESLNAASIPFEQGTLQDDVKDLSYLSKYVAGKKVIGLGEPNHGTHEIFTTKNRIVKYLIENEEFKTIVFESHMDNLHHVNDFVTGENNLISIDSVMGQFIHVFRTEEIKSLVLWLKEYNKGKAVSDKVHFHGCDMQDDKQSVRYLRTFAKKNDEELLGLLVAYEEEYKVYENLDIIKQIQKHLEKEKSNYKVSKLKYNRIKHSAFLLEQFAIFDANLGNRTIHRDSCMANNLLWVLDKYDREKAIFWADNYHTKKQPTYSAGGYLSKILKEKYYVVGMYLSKGFTNGKFSNSSILSPRLLPSNPEHFLNTAKDSVYFLSSENFCDEFNKQEKVIVSMEDLCELNYYDAIIHIKNASPAIEIE